jgi:8-oxo-dGTP pyrophosphatase MutT (NUDIX family)
VSAADPFERQLRAALAGPLPGPQAQRRFAPRPIRERWSPEMRPDGARQAAALLLIHPGPHGPSIPLTVRRRDLPHHPGQVSLPGGALAPGERADAAALREAEEEIGLPRESVRIVGALSTVWIAVSNFVVHPFVGVTDAPVIFRPEPHEVAALIEVRVADLRDRGRLKWSRRLTSAGDIEYPYFDVCDQQVWGATAIILGEFVCLFEQP